MTKIMIGTAVGALALGSLLTAQAMKSPSGDASASVRAVQTRPAGMEASAGPVLVNCGEGRRALVRPVGLGEQRVSQVDCVETAATLPVTVDAWGQPVSYGAQAAPVLAATSYPPIVYRSATPTTARTQVVYRDRPTYRPAATTAAQRRPVTEVRSWKKSALIIGGSAAGGAAVGAILDGKDGAKKGAVLGGVAGTVYDVATRSKTRY